MTSLTRRLEALEITAPQLSPAIKRWLGWPPTADEERQCEANQADAATTDTSNLSPELKQWLGLD